MKKNRTEKHPDEAKLMSTSEATRLLKGCNRWLAESLEKCDWEAVEKAIEDRDKLLHDLMASLERPDLERMDEKRLAEKRRIRWLLEDIQSENDRFIQDLEVRINAQRDKLKQIHKGRSTLQRYKSPPRNEARFLNRFG
jgi:hypothetical protein